MKLRNYGKVVFSNYKAICAGPGRQLGCESANVALDMMNERLEPTHLARVTALQEQQEVEGDFDGQWRWRCERAATEQHCKDRLAASHTKGLPLAAGQCSQGRADNWLRGAETKPQDDNGEVPTPTAGEGNCITARYTNIGKEEIAILCARGKGRQRDRS